MEEVIVLGDGIAGLTAAIYTARADLDPVVIKGPESGGQLTWTTDVENFPGFPDGVQGPQLIQNCREQAKRFGASFENGVVTDISKDADSFTVTFSDDTSLKSKSVIVATGASARWLELDNEETFRGNGVSTCATCDGFFFNGDDVIVVGGGDSAMEESIFLTKYASSVTVVHRRDELRASEIMQERFFANDKTDIMWSTEVVEYIGDEENGITGVVLHDNNTGEEYEYDIDGVFLAIGHEPNTDFLEGLVSLTDRGYVEATPKTHTECEGLFAAGDVQDQRFRQAVTAAGSGCKAAMEAEEYLNMLHH